MNFKYKATSTNLQIIEGSIDAKNATEAAVSLRNQNLTPITINKQGTGARFSIPFLNKSSSGDLVVFTRQLSSMLSSGLTIMQSLRILKDQMQKESMQNVIGGLISEIEEGKSFSGALAKFPEVFSPIYVSLIHAAEGSGFLDKILLKMADNLEKDQKLKATIKSALLYPIIVVIMMVAVVVVMMIFVIPQLSKLYDSLNVTLPFTTQIVVGISNFTVSYWWIVLAATIVVASLYTKWSKSESGSLIIDHIVLRLPIFGPLIQKSILSEFCRTLGLLIGSGTLVVQSLNQTSNVVGNKIYEDAIIDISRHVEKGISVGDAMGVYPIFPPILVQMVRIGEQTGKLDESLIRVSEYFEREVENLVKTLTTAMEPIIMIVLGVGVAFLVLSIITPIYNITNSIQ